MIGANLSLLANALVVVVGIGCAIIAAVGRPPVLGMIGLALFVLAQVPILLLSVLGRLYGPALLHAVDILGDLLSLAGVALLLAGLFARARPGPPPGPGPYPPPRATPPPAGGPGWAGPPTGPQGPPPPPGN